MTTPTEHARFRFKSKGLEVEFEGHDDFLSAQIEHLKPALERELARLAASATKPAGDETAHAASGAGAATPQAAAAGWHAGAEFRPAAGGPAVPGG